MNRVRTVIVVVALMALVGWGVYDNQAKKSKEKELILQQQLDEEKQKLLAQQQAIMDNNGLEQNVQIEEGSNEEDELVVGLKKGNIAPDFVLESLDGEERKLSDYRGKKVILNMWATWCPPCREEMPDMQKMHEQHGDSDIAIVAVNLTSSEQKIEDITEFVEEYGLTFPILLDPKDQVAGRYQVTSIPTSYILDAEGKIQQKVVGPMSFEMMSELLEL
ncbi:TlpA disulfide reductase family protein [Paenibacillus yanchengensis]|uniref:TlpA disulfide reductase family protein n=1 Tax=Paenibacillus yanchengensis TaxID=2035833 RepID=A0ABW4YNV2_9BACL